MKAAARCAWAIAIASLAFASPGMEITPQTGHGEDVQHVAFSADGRLALSTSEDMTAKLWQIESGQLLRTLRGHTGMVTWAVFTPDGKHAVTTSFDHSAILWNIETGNPVRRFSGHEHIAWCADVSADGRHLITAGNDNTVRLWDLNGGTVLHTFDRMYVVRWVRFSPDGRKALAKDTTNLYLLDLETFGMHLVERNTAHVEDAAFSADGATIVTAGGDKEVRLWSVATGQLLRTFSGHVESVRWATFGADGQPVSSDFRGAMIYWNADSSRRRNVTLASGDADLRIDGFGDDGSIAFSVNQEEFTVFQTDAPFVRRTFSGYRQQIGALSVAGNLIITMTDEWEVHLWNASTGAHLRTIIADRGHGIDIGKAMLSVAPRVRRILTGHYGVVKLWDLDTGALIHETRHNEMTEAVVLAADGKRAVIGGYAMPLALWDVTTGQEILRFSGQTGTVHALAIAPDQQSILAGSDDLQVRQWRLSDGTLLWETETRAEVAAIAFSADSRRALLFSNATGELVDLASGSVLRAFQAHARPGSVAWHPNGNHFVASGGTLMGTDADTVRVWNATTGEMEWEGSGHLGTVHAAAFSEDGAHVITGAADGTVRIWHRPTRQSITLIARGEEWLIFRSEGYFDASRHGGDLAAAVAGTRAWRIDQLAARYNRPDLVLAHAGLGSPELLGHYRARHELRLRRLGLSRAVVDREFENAPKLTIAGLQRTNRAATIRLQFTAATHPLARYNVFINGVPLFGALGKPLAAGTVEASELLALSAGRNRIEASVTDASGVESLRDFRVVDLEGPAETTLYFIGFGVSQYADPSLRLNYAHRDALELAKYFRRVIGVSGAARVKTFVNEEAKVEAFQTAKAFLAGAAVDDIVVVFFAGHGTYLRDADAEYVLLTHESDRSRLRETAASFDLLESLFAHTAARRRLLLIDACESGDRDGELEVRHVTEANARGLIPRTARNLRPAAPPPPRRPFLLERDRYIYNDLARRTGAVVYSSSLGSELSYERSDLRNGVFTNVLLRALTSPAADRDNDHLVSMDELRAFVSPAVAGITGDLQHPTIDRDNADAAIALPISPESLSP